MIKRVNIFQSEIIMGIHSSGLMRAFICKQMGYSVDNMITFQSLLYIIFHRESIILEGGGLQLSKIGGCQIKVKGG